MYVLLRVLYVLLRVLYVLLRLPAHEGNERGEEHFTVMFSIEITALFRGHVKSSLL